MPISFSCSCGHLIRVPDSKAGALGKCPACSASVRVPSPAVAVASFERSASESSPLEMADEAEAATTKANPPCPHCGTQYDPDVVICVACGLNLLTGQPVGAGPSTEPFRTRHPVANDEPDTDSIGFWKMTAGVLLRPLQTMEYFGALFARPEMLAKATVFYAASFVAVAVAAVLAAHPDRNAGLQAAAAEVERVHRVDPHIPQDWVDVTQWSQGLTEWGEPFSFRVLEPLGAIEAGKPFTLRMLVMEPGRTKGAVGTAKVALTPAHGNAPGNDWHVMKPGSREGEYVVELPATREGGSSYAFDITCRADTQAGKQKCSRCCVHLTWTHNPGWGQLVLEDRQARMVEAARAKGLPAPASAPADGGVMGAALGTAGMIASLVFNVIGLLISAAIFTGAARMLGGGGGFTLMLVTMAYLTGFSNFFQFLVVLAPLKLQMWLQAFLLVYGFSLQLFALMKVYDIDILQALFTTVVAWGAKLLGAAYLVMVALKAFGMA